MQAVVAFTGASSVMLRNRKIFRGWLRRVSRPGPAAIKIVEKTIPYGLNFCTSSRCVAAIHRLDLVLTPVSEFNNTTQKIVVILFHLIPMMGVGVKMSTTESVGILLSSLLRCLRFAVLYFRWFLRRGHGAFHSFSGSGKVFRWYVVSHRRC